MNQQRANPFLWNVTSLRLSADVGIRIEGMITLSFQTKRFLALFITKDAAIV
jgi:hypothetical protein